MKYINNSQLYFKYEASNNKKYEIDSIYNHTVYTKRLLIEQLLKVYKQVL